MSTVDPNTERRMERLRQQRTSASGGDSAAATSKFAASPAQPAGKPSSSSSSSATSWLVGAAVFVGGGLLLRSLLRGTAPSSASRYSKLMSRDAAGAAAPHAVPSTPWSARDQHQSHSRTYQTHSSHTSHAQHKQQQQQQQQQSWTASDDYHSAQARQAAYERKWAKAQSDYARFEALQNQAREAWVSGERVHRPGAYATRDRTADAAFDLEMEQARADYVQSKFHALKQSKRVTRYEIWTGNARSSGSGTAEEEEERMREEALAAGEDPDEVHSRFMAFQAIHRQLATSAKYVQARALLFNPPAASSSSAANTDASSLFHPSLDTFASLPPLTSQAVRAAYFKRAKEVHPDVVGGNAAQFQALTDAYELLVDALEPIEKHARERAEREATKKQQQSTGASSEAAKQ